MNKTLFFVLLVSPVFVPALNAQRPVPERVRYERMFAVVPMVGAGTWDDPRRPMFTPTPKERSEGRSRRVPKDVKPTRADLERQPEITSFHYQVSDNGRFALVEFVAQDRRAFQELLEYRGPELKVFKRGRSKRGDILQEFRKYKKDFDWQEFLGVE